MSALYDNYLVCNDEIERLSAPFSNKVHTCDNLEEAQYRADLYKCEKLKIKINASVSLDKRKRYRKRLSKIKKRIKSACASNPHWLI